jgi:hypothetical protein
VDCEHASDQISARLDGELPLEELPALEAHLASCPSCRATAESFARQDGEMRRALAPRRRAAAASAVAVVDQIIRAPRIRRRWFNRRAFRYPALIATIAAALLLIQRFRDGSPPRPQLAFSPPPGRTPARTAEPTRKAAFVLERITARPIASPPKAVELKSGQTIETGSVERRRFAMPGGGTVFVDRDTRFRFDGEAQRTIALTRGAIFIPALEMAGTLVKTVDRAVFLVTGNAEVRSDGERSAVLLTTGLATVLPVAANAGQDGVVTLAGGYELAAGEWNASPAPRASALLDWTYDLMAEGETPLVPPGSYAGGALIAIDANGEESKLSLRKYHVDVHVEDGFARTTIDQTYFNHHPWRMEGTFRFPLPPDASLSRLAMYVDGNLMEGGMVERDRGRKVYEEIVRSQRDPALLEWVDGSTFRMRVFPLEGRQEKRIILSYTQRLPDSFGKTSYRFPAGHSLQTVRDWSFHALVKGGASLHWNSPTHASLQGIPRGRDLVLTDSEANVKVDRDLVFELFSPERPEADTGARFVSAELDGVRYLMLRYRPELPTPAVDLAPRNWVFVCECSADRDPLLARTQIEVLRHFLSCAAPGDTFDVVAAGTRTQRLSPAAIPVNPQSIEAAVGFLEKAHLIGALDLGHAFDEVAGLLKGGNSWLVHLGSGYVGMGCPEQGLAARLPPGVRYLGIGVGNRWNRAFMKAMAERTGGFFTQINPDTCVTWQAFDLMATLNSPRLTGITVNADGPGGTRRPSFVSEGSTLRQGEELFAAARLADDDGRLLPTPNSVTVRGTLAGRPYTTTLQVKNVRPDASYLPRTWAKLELERLVAADAAANRQRIVDLSKAMYVMSPFTSLLVLEDDAMYARYNVDRGRKDHWAMYPCPQRVPVVYEPDPTQPVDDRNAPKQPKPSANRVLETVLVRPVLASPGTLADSGLSEKETSAYGIKGEIIRLGDLRMSSTNESASNSNWDNLTVETFGDVGRRDLAPESLQRKAVRRTRIEPQLTSGVFSPYGFIDVFSPTHRSNLGLAPWGDDIDSRSSEVTLGQIRSLEFATDITHEPTSIGSARLLRRPTIGQIQLEPPGPDRLFRLEKMSAVHDRMRRIVPERININTIWDPEVFRTKYGAADYDSADRIDALMATWDRNDPILSRVCDYERPRFNGNDRMFADLVAYAPAINTSRADLLAVLEDESAPVLAAEPGQIDPGAHRLIEAARAGGWQTLALPDGKGHNSVAVVFDPAGRYAYERTLTLGLRERVVCDGSTLLHLYPELGIGARRSVTRFHRANLLGALPWLVPPAEDLARGADLRQIDDHTIAVVPRRERARWALHLIFGGGRLVERRLIAVGSKRVIAREEYDGAGGVRLLDENGKEQNHWRAAIRPADAVDLRPDTSGLLILSLPFRSREHVFEKYGLEPGEPLTGRGNAWHECLPESSAVDVLGVALATGNAADAVTLVENTHSLNLARRRGLFTVLAACGVDVAAAESFRRARAEHPDDPLLRYFDLQGNSANDWLVRNFPHYRANLVLGGGFLHRLADLHDLTQRWQSRPWSGTEPRARQVDVERTLSFVRQNPGSAAARAVVNLAAENLTPELKQLALALADAHGIDAAASGEFTDRYEQARLLFMGGRRDEAARSFLALFGESLKEGQFPVFDDGLREALLAGGEWGQVVRNAAAGLLEQNRREALLALTWRCRQIGDAPLAEHLFGLAIDRIPEDERLSVTLDAVQYLRQWKEAARADGLLRDLTAARAFESDARLWRLRSTIAAEMGREDDAAIFLERTLDLEFNNLPPVIDLVSWRRDYGEVLAHCRGLARAAGSLGTRPPADLEARITRAAERWRLHDPESADACDAAADLITELGDADLGWDYLTTAAVQRSPERPPWRKIAESRHSIGDFATAERAYAAACAAEPADADIVWERARNLRQAGKKAEAAKLLRRLADGDWPAPIRERARWQLEVH